MKIGIVIGTRPEIIKMSPVIQELNDRDIEYFMVHTTQHYDWNMSSNFFKELGIDYPDYKLGTNPFQELKDYLKNENPDIVLVQGDTNSTLMGALATKRVGLKLGHIEAGLRSYDKTMQEEMNRVMVDHISDLLFTPTYTSFYNLLRESIDIDQIFITGNTGIDTCFQTLNKLKREGNLIKPFDSKNYILFTFHRAENINEKSLKELTGILLKIKKNIIFPVHPRTEKALKEYGLYNLLNKSEHIYLYSPVGYSAMLNLLYYSKLVITDSGGIQEESIALNVPCITLRDNTERPESITNGGNILVKDKSELLGIIKAIENPEYYNKMSHADNPYGKGNASKIIVDYLSKELSK